jgi:5-methylcytosine-specific restriction endonuclease McrA
MRGEPLYRVPRPVPRLLAKQKAASQEDRAWWTLRRVVLARDKHMCRACQSTHGLEMHHVIFRSLGGKDEAENLIMLCIDCHRAVHGHVLTFRVMHRMTPQRGMRFTWVTA